MFSSMPAQFPQASAQVGQAIGGLPLLFTFPFPSRHREHGSAIGVDVYHASVLPDVFPQHTHVVWGRIAFHKAAPTPTGGVVDHPHQITHRSATFQPIVLGSIPLHQFAEPAAPWPPAMHLLNSARTSVCHMLRQAAIIHPRRVSLPT